MNEAKHTPGPWVTGGLSGAWPNQTIGIMRKTREINGGEHAAVNVLSRTDEARQVASANARLIAASPDLLAALSQLLDEYIEDALAGEPGCGCQPAELCGMCKAKDAIAKATGK